MRLLAVGQLKQVFCGTMLQIVSSARTTRTAVQEPTELRNDQTTVPTFFSDPELLLLFCTRTAELEFVVQKKLAAEKAAAAADEGAENKGTGNRQLFMQFTCNQCEGVSQYMINKNAYEDGIVICTCQKCHVRHLLADNLKKVSSTRCVRALSTTVRRILSTAIACVLPVHVFLQRASCFTGWLVPC